MKKPSAFRYICAEALIMLNFIALVAGLVMLPLLDPTPLSLIALGFGLLLSIAIAFIYGLFISRNKPPRGEA